MLHLLHTYTSWHMNGYAGLSTPWAGYLKHKMNKVCKYLSTHAQHVRALSPPLSTLKNSQIPRNSSFHKTLVLLIERTDNDPLPGEGWTCRQTADCFCLISYDLMNKQMLR